MKIGFLITYFYPKSGGAENNCFYLARELVKKHEVHVFCSGEDNVDEVIDGVFIHRCKEWFRLTYYLGVYPSLVKRLKMFKLDIHVHGFGFLQHDLAIYSLKKVNPNLKIVCTPHGPFMCLKDYSFFAKWFKKLYLPFIRDSLKGYDKIIQVNPYQYKWMYHEYHVPKSKVEFIPNGILNSVFDELSPKKTSDILRKFSLEGKFIISYLGRIQKYKGMEQVVKVLPDLIDNNLDICFVAIGKDLNYSDELKNLAMEFGVFDHFCLTGEVSEEEKLALLDASEIFVFPSEWEAFGIVVLEAMARNNAVVSSKTEGGKYLISEGENGFLFDYGDLDKLKEELHILIEDVKLRDKMKKANFLKSKKYIWEDIALMLEKLYKELL